MSVDTCITVSIARLGVNTSLVVVATLTIAMLAFGADTLAEKADVD